MDSLDCKHEQFQANANVFRLQEDDNREPKSYAVDLRIHCAQCGLPFEFVGLPMGVSPNEPTVSIDCQEARIPIIPAKKLNKSNTIAN